MFQEFLGLLFFLKITYWFIVTVLKCFGIVKEVEVEEETKQSESTSDELRQKHLALEGSTIQEKINQIEEGLNKNKPLVISSKSKKNKKSKLNQKAGTLPQNAIKNQFNEQANQNQKGQDGIVEEVKSQKIQIEKTNPYTQSFSGKHYQQHYPLVRMVDSFTQTETMDQEGEELQSKLALLDALANQAIIQELMKNQDLCRQLQETLKTGQFALPSLTQKVEAIEQQQKQKIVLGSLTNGQSQKKKKQKNKSKLN